MVKVSISISFEWIPFGAVTLDPNGKILFPKSPPCAGLYRFEFSSAIGTIVYIGQTDQIARRFQHYRTPGPSQQTNLRLNQMMRDALANEGFVSISLRSKIFLFFGNRSNMKSILLRSPNESCSNTRRLWKHSRRAQQS